MATDSIKSLTDLIEILKMFWSRVDRHHHIRLWYRGQGQEDWPLSPGVYRPDFNVATEQQRLEKEQQMLQDFKVQSASLLSGNPSEADLYFLMQHYKMPTRLLDWTYSPLTALYFVVSDRPEKDGALFMMDAYELATTQNLYGDSINGFKGTPTSHLPLFQRALRTISDWKGYDHFPKCIIAIRPYYTDKRIQLQKGCFTFHVPEGTTLTEAKNKTLAKYIVCKEDKPEILRQLSLLGVSDFTTFGDMESLSRTLIKNHF